MNDYAKLSDKKFRSVFNRCNARWNEMVNVAIESGLGACSHREMVDLAKGSSLSGKAQVARMYLNAFHDRRVAWDEFERRGLKT